MSHGETNTLGASAAVTDPLLGRVRLGEDRGRPALLVDGVVQSVAPADGLLGYWGAMLPAQRPARALLLGLGGGTLAYLLTRRFGPVAMVGVDDDPEVIVAARTAFGALPASLQIVLADARRFVAGCAGHFDYVAVDLYHGNQTPGGVYARPFLRDVRAALTPRGTVVFNIFRDQRLAERIARITSVLRLVREVRVRDNVLLHCRR